MVAVYADAKTKMFECYYNLAAKNNMATEKVIEKVGSKKRTKIEVVTRVDLS